MKKRVSINSSEYNDRREESYKKDSLEIAYRFGFKLIERDSTVYKVKDDIEEPFCTQDRAKRLWFQTWIKLKKQSEK